MWGFIIKNILLYKCSIDIYIDLCECLCVHASLFDFKILISGQVFAISSSYFFKHE